MKDCVDYTVLMFGILTVVIASASGAGYQAVAATCLLVVYVVHDIFRPFAKK